jgi:hypothetical protein
MRALTVRQPWAWAIVAGGKTVENRSRNTHYRGLVAVHAGKVWSTRGQVSAVLIAWGKAGYRDRRLTQDSPEITFGAVIGAARIVDAHPAAGCCPPWGEDDYHGEGRQIWHWVLEGARQFAEPVPVDGHLGLWTVPAPQRLWVEQALYAADVEAGRSA